MRNFAINESSFRNQVIENGQYNYLYFNKSFKPASYRKCTEPIKLYIINDDKVVKFVNVVDMVYNTQFTALLDAKRGFYFVMEKYENPTRIENVEPMRQVRAVDY
jgi:hypothetical protein